MSPSPQPDPPPRQLALRKKGHCWVVRYSPGEEPAVVRCLARLASDPSRDFNWLDAAVLAHQMGGQMHQQLKELAPE